MNIGIEKMELLKKYSEGNKYLYDLLIACEENGIRTFACCAGHNDDVRKPYIGILIDDKSILAIRRAIARLQYMKDIRFDYFIRRTENETMEDSECRGLTIFGEISNRCEMFYKLTQAIIEERETNLSSEASEFYSELVKFKDSNYETIKQSVAIGRTNSIVGEFSTISDDLIVYNIGKHSILHNVRLLKAICNKISAKFREKSQELDKLKRRYAIMQEEYIPTMKESLKTPRIKAFCAYTYGEIAKVRGLELEK